MRFWKVKVSSVEVLVTVDFRLRERAKRSPMLARILGFLGLLGGEPQAEPDLGPPRVDKPGDSPERAEIFARLDGIEWYHCIDVGHGVTTPGAFDHTPQLRHYHLPDDLTGQRVIDVATKDGFFAFEFEKRGASEVVALDIDTYAELDWPPQLRPSLDPAMLAGKMGAGFEVAHELRGSKVIRHTENVYQMSPESVGKFDLVFSGSYLLHLMNPQLALANMCKITRGRAIIVDQFHPHVPREFMLFLGATVDMCWWYYSIESLEKMILNAGFREVRLLDKFPLKSIKGEMWHATYEALV